jgi:hypothetical protein
LLFPGTPDTSIIPIAFFGITRTGIAHIIHQPLY